MRVGLELERKVLLDLVDVRSRRGAHEGLLEARAARGMHSGAHPGLCVELGLGVRVRVWV